MKTYQYTVLLLLFLISLSYSLKSYTNHYPLSQFINSPKSKQSFSFRALISMKNSQFESNILSLTHNDIRIISNSDFTSNPLTSKYLSLVKYSDIDLPCNNNLFICSYKEYKNEYNTTVTLVSIPDESKCLLITQGNIIQDLIYVCLENIEDSIFIMNIITERVLYSQRNVYEGENVQLMKNTNDGYYYGKISIYQNYFEYHITEKEKITFKYDTINGYAHNVFDYKYTQWKGNPILVPKKDYCFTVNVINHNFYFCAFYDNKKESSFSLINANFIIQQFISKINSNLHIFNLKKSQINIKNCDCLNSCDVDILKPIKYEIQLRYNIAKHKMNQMILLNKLTNENAIDSLKHIKEKIIDRSCLSHEPCISLMSKCINDKVINYKYTNSLNNPFGYIMNNELAEVVKEYDKEYTPIIETPMPDRKEIIESNNVFKKIFRAKENNREINSFEESINYCRIHAYGNEYELKRKIDFLTYSTKSEPFFLYMKNINH